MSTDSFNSLKIAWWNTGTAPPVGRITPGVPNETLQKGIVRLCSECDLTILGAYVMRGFYCLLLQLSYSFMQFLFA